MYLSKTEVVKSDFLLVSYKHDTPDKNNYDASEIVFPIVDALIEEGVRLWIDEVNKFGQSWIENVKELIHHPNCRGVLFFNSVLSFMSSAIDDERRLVLEHKKKCDKMNIHFKILSVNIKKPSIFRLLRHTFETLEDNDAAIDHAFGDKDHKYNNIKTILDLFPYDVLSAYANGLNNDECKNKLYEALEDEEFAGVIDKSKLQLREMAAFSRIDPETSLSSIHLGFYKGEKAPLRLLPNQTDGQLIKDSQLYLVENNQAYYSCPLEWLVLYSKNGEFTLLSQHIIDIHSGGDDIFTWLSSVFLNLAFSKEFSPYILSVHLLRDEDITLSESPNILRATPLSTVDETRWWMASQKDGTQKVINRHGKGNYYPCRTSDIGVRPCIRIKADDLPTLLQLQKERY